MTRAMNRSLRLLIMLALVGASLFPTLAFAEPAGPTPHAHAVCTQIEPIYRRNGVSFYGGTGMCEVIAEVPQAFDWMSVPLDPESSGMAVVCAYWLSGAHDEYAAAWAQPGYQWVAAEYCYGMRRGGVDVTFFDDNYR